MKSILESWFLSLESIQAEFLLLSNNNMIDKIIQKAIDGGFPQTKNISIYEITMSPVFWKCLEKSCGWNPWVMTRNGIKVKTLQEHEYRQEREKLGDYGIGDPEIRYIPTSIFYGSYFHEINLTDSFDKAVEYLESLLDK